MDELEQLKQEKQELEQQVAKLTADKDDISKNFDNYRNGHKYKNEDYDIAVTERDKFKGDFETLNGSVEQERTERREKFIQEKKKELSKGDAKVLSAIEAEYAILNMPEDSEENIAARLEKARSIAVSSMAPAPSAHDAAGTPSATNGSNNEAPSEASNALLGTFMGMAGAPKK